MSDPEHTPIPPRDEIIAELAHRVKGLEVVQLPKNAQWWLNQITVFMFFLWILVLSQALWAEPMCQQVLSCLPQFMCTDFPATQ